MSTPNYDKLVNKVLQWSNRDPEVFGVTNSNPTAWKDYIGDFLNYSADEAYRRLRIPPMEWETTYTIESTDLIGSPNMNVLGTNNWAGSGSVSYNKILLPVDFIEMKSIRLSSMTTAIDAANQQQYVANPGIVFNERTDERTFHDLYAETYSNFYWMRAGDYLYIKPALPVGSKLTFGYYRQLPALNADYSVVGANFLLTDGSAPSIPPAPQPVQYFLNNFNPTLNNQWNILAVSSGYTISFTGTIPLSSADIKIGYGIYSTGGTLLCYITGINYSSNNTTIVSVSVDRQVALGNISVYITGGAPLWLVYYEYGLSGSAQTLVGGAYDSYAAAQTGATTLAATYTTPPPNYVPFNFTANTTPLWFNGNEVANWLKDQNERVLIWGALWRMGSFLDDEKMEARYEKQFTQDIMSLNDEEKRRRAKGGNIQVTFNGMGLI